MKKRLYFFALLPLIGVSALSAAQGASQQEETTPLADYTQGVFVVNEDWTGHQNSTVNFLKDDGEWIYRVVQQENPGVEVGCTSEFGTIYGNRFYVISKQDQDPGAGIAGGRVTVCSAADMKLLKQIRILSTDPEATSGANGRGFVGVDEHKGYVGSSDGIFVLNLDDFTITGKVTGSGNGADNDYDAFYGGQIAAPVARDIFSQLLRFMHISPSSDTFADMNKDKEAAAAKPAPAASDGKVRMPDLTGMSIRDVSQKLAELGLGIDVQGNGLARSQSIPAGAEIKSGQSVTVTFSP